MRLNGTIPVETELFLSVLCPILINHYMAGKKTEQTINFLLDATEAYLRIDSIKNALSYLDKVQEIISMLDKDSVLESKYLRIWTRIFFTVLKGYAEFHNTG